MSKPRMFAKHGKRNGDGRDDEVENAEQGWERIGEDDTEENEALRDVDGVVPAIAPRLVVSKRAGGQSCTSYNPLSLAHGHAIDIRARSLTHI